MATGSYSPVPAEDDGSFFQVEQIEEGEGARTPRLRGVPPAARFGRGAALAALVACGVVAFAAAGLAGSHRRESADVEASQDKVGILAAVATVSQSMSSAAKFLNDAQNVSAKMHDDVNGIFGPALALKNDTLHDALASGRVNLGLMGNMSEAELLKPKTEDRHDGNRCASDEEEHLSLCYKKCSVLTNNKYPIRTTAFSCCMEEPCSFFNSKFTNPVTACQGFDVSGDREGSGCPHELGTCMPNEEFSVGSCYKKCALLTENKFPYRSGAMSCCRYKNHWACLDALNVVTNSTFAVGGGVGDNHNSTPATYHLPMPKLTESSNLN